MKDVAEFLWLVVLLLIPVDLALLFVDILQDAKP
jgi:hypothetical protein